MAYWTGGHIVRQEDAPIDGYPGWVSRDCGCCGGTRWGDPGPCECPTCSGNGYFAVHLATGTVALYPGGPLLGWHEKKA